MTVLKKMKTKKDGRIHLLLNHQNESLKTSPKKLKNLFSHCDFWNRDCSLQVTYDKQVQSQCNFTSNLITRSKSNTLIFF